MDIGGGEGVSVYAEAKSEYTRQLCQLLVHSLHKFFLDLLDQAKEKEPDQRKLLLTFQKLLEEITDWNADKVQRETAAIISATQCDYLEELLTAVFIAHTKVLSAIRLTSRQKKLQITIPKLDHFVHRSMTECARLLWANTYLFSMSGTSIERQKNQRQIESFITDGVLQGIRGMLPVKNILREYLKDDGDDDEEAEDKAVAAEKVEAVAEEKVEAVAEEPEEKVEAVAVAEEKPAEEKAEEKVAVAEEKIAVAEEKDAEKVEQPPTIIVDTSPQVTFTGINSVFDGDNSGLEEMKDGDDEFVDEFQIMDTPPEPLTDFEEVGNESSLPGEILPMEFETL